MKKQGQDKHRESYFYKFVFYYFKDHLKDKPNYKKLIKEILENWLQIVINIVGSVFIIAFIYYYISFNEIKTNIWLSSGVVLLVTSLVTGSFFLVKIYIENQLNKKEKEMLKEYQQTLDKQKKVMLKEYQQTLDKQKKEMLKEYQQTLDKQTKDSNKKFDKINEILIAIKGDLDNIKNN